MFARKKKAAKKRQQADFDTRQEESQQRLQMMRAMAGPEWDDERALDNVQEGDLDEGDAEWWTQSVQNYEDPMESWIHDKRKAERDAELKALGGGSIGDGTGKIANRGSEGEGRDVRDMTEDPRFAMLHRGSKKERKQVGAASGHHALTEKKTIAQKIPFARTVASVGGVYGQHQRAKENDAIHEHASDNELAKSMSEGFASDRRRDRNVGVGKSLYNGAKDAMLVASLGGTDLMAEGLGAISTGIKGLVGTSSKVHSGVEAVKNSPLAGAVKGVGKARKAVPEELASLTDKDRALTGELSSEKKSGLVNGVRKGAQRGQDDLSLLAGKGVAHMLRDKSTYSKDERQVLGDARDVDEDEESEDDLLQLGARMFSESDRADEQNQNLIGAFGSQGKRRFRKDESRGLRETMLNYLDHDDLTDNSGRGEVGSVLRGARYLQGDGRTKQERKHDKKSSKQSNKAGNALRADNSVQGALEDKQQSDPNAKLGWRERRKAKKVAGTVESSVSQEHTLRPSQVARLDRGEQARNRQQERMGTTEMDDEDNLLERMVETNKKRWYE